MSLPKMTESELGRKIVFNLKRAENAYKTYLGFGKKYIYAKNIKKANDCIRELIVEHSPVSPKFLENDLLELLEHVEIWTSYWEDLEQKNSPELHDEFVFQNEHQFPKEACQNIIAHFEKNEK